MTLMSPTVDAAYILVDYAWAVLHANESETWSTSNYKNLIPIVPLSEERELSEFSGPHIVYGYAEEGSGGLYARTRGSLTFAVYDQNYRRLSRALNYLRTAFERQDESARDINRFSTYFNGTQPVVSRTTNPDGSPKHEIVTPGVPGQYHGIRFGFTEVAFVEGGTPEDTEGGRQSGLISITYEYYVDYDIQTSFD